MRKRTGFRCEKCKGTSFVEQAHALVCTNCDTESQHAQVEEAEYDGVGGRYKKLAKLTKKQQFKKEEKRDMTRGEFLFCFQRLLKVQAEALVLATGVSPAVLKEVQQIWFAYLTSTLIDAEPYWENADGDGEAEGVERREDEGGSSRATGHASRGGSEKSPTGSSARMPPEHSHVRTPSNIVESLAICLLACLNLREALLPADIIRLVANCTLPYTRATEYLPPELTNLSGRYAAALRWPLKSYLTVNTLCDQVGKLAGILGVQVPMCNVPLVVLRAIRGCFLPERMSQFAYRLLCRYPPQSKRMDSRVGGAVAAAAVVVVVKLTWGLQEHNLTDEGHSLAGVQRKHPFENWAALYLSETRGETPAVPSNFWDVARLAPHAATQAKYSEFTRDLLANFRSGTSEMLPLVNLDKLIAASKPRSLYRASAAGRSGGFSGAQAVAISTTTAAAAAGGGNGGGSAVASTGPAAAALLATRKSRNSDNPVGSSRYIPVFSSRRWGSQFQCSRSYPVFTSKVAKLETYPKPYVFLVRALSEYFMLSPETVHNAVVDYEKVTIQAERELWWRSDEGFAVYDVDNFFEAGQDDDYRFTADDEAGVSGDARPVPPSLSTTTTTTTTTTATTTAATLATTSTTTPVAAAAAPVMATPPRTRSTSASDRLNKTTPTVRRVGGGGFNPTNYDDDGDDDYGDDDDAFPSTPPLISSSPSRQRRRQRSPPPSTPPLVDATFARPTAAPTTTRTTTRTPAPPTVPTTAGERSGGGSGSGSGSQGRTESISHTRKRSESSADGSSGDGSESGSERRTESVSLSRKRKRSGSESESESVSLAKRKHSSSDGGVDESGNNSGSGSGSGSGGSGSGRDASSSTTTSATATALPLRRSKRRRLN